MLRFVVPACWVVYRYDKVKYEYNPLYMHLLNTIYMNTTSFVRTNVHTT